MLTPLNCLYREFGPHWMLGYTSVFSKLFVVIIQRFVN